MYISRLSPLILWQSCSWVDAVRETHFGRKLVGLESVRDEILKNGVPIETELTLVDSSSGY
jgi:hypothetical protein